MTTPDDTSDPLDSSRWRLLIAALTALAADAADQQAWLAAHRIETDDLALDFEKPAPRPVRFSPKAAVRSCTARHPPGPAFSRERATVDEVVSNAFGIQENPETGELEIFGGRETTAPGRGSRTSSVTTPSPGPVRMTGWARPTDPGDFPDGYWD
ncbi:hypothetical protein ACT1U9_30830 [Streptomyces sp. BR1]|uniref:hypothetical protein n=1 Tax=Streptomyces sp. BR1 TaxID=1592323 RepID=UPI00402B3BC7